MGEPEKYAGFISLLERRGGVFDAFIFYVVCFAAYALRLPGYYAVVPALTAATAAALCAFSSRGPVQVGLFAGYAALCVFFPAFLLLLPVAAYPLPMRLWRFLPAALVPAVAAFARGQWGDALLTLFLLVLGVYFRARGEALARLRGESIELRDSAKELSMRLARKNRDLLERQDYEVSLATMDERNRIARDIHDGVGHLLSSALLQVGALLAASPEPARREALGTLRGTLSQAMDAIRAGVHGLYDDSIDLPLELRRLAEAFTFCPVLLSCELKGDPGRKRKLAVIAILKEALANVARHSNATQVAVRLCENPGFYQFVVSDNGTRAPAEGGVCAAGGENGIGLNSIAERVEELGGILNIRREQGFRIFVTFPKQNRKGGG